jgi:hypothetical protein
VGHTTRYGSHRRERKIPRRPPDPRSRAIAAAGAVVAFALLALLVGDRVGQGPTGPQPTPTPPRAERLAEEVADTRRRFLASLTPTPDVDLEQVRTELALQQTEVCTDACPRSAPGDCSLRELRVVSREARSLRVEYSVACGPVRLPSGEWIYHSRLVERSASFDRFGGRWLMAGFGAPPLVETPESAPPTP